MKKIFFIITSLIIMSQSVMAADDEIWEQTDKQKHFVVTTAISAAVTGIARNHGLSKTESFFWGFGVALAVGLAKEASDSGNDRDKKDFVSDAAGSLVGALVSAQFEWKF